MTRLRIFLFRLSALVRSRRMDREIDEEITSHLAEATEEYVRRGLSLEEARRAAQRSFGGVPQTKEVYRQVRSFMWLDDTQSLKDTGGKVTGPGAAWGDANRKMQMFDNLICNKDRNLSNILLAANGEVKHVYA